MCIQVIFTYKAILRGKKVENERMMHKTHIWFSKCNKKPHKSIILSSFYPSEQLIKVKNGRF